MKLSGTESGIFGPWLTGSGLPDPLFSIQKQNPVAVLPPSTLPSLFTYQPPVVRMRVCVCISQLLCPPPPQTWHPCSSAPPHCPACSQSWHGTISNLSPSCLLGLRGTGSLSALLPLPSRQLPLPLLSHKHSLRSPHCHLPTLQLRLLLTVSCKEYFTPSCFVCVFILHG